MSCCLVIFLFLSYYGDLLETKAIPLQQFHVSKGYVDSGKIQEYGT